MRTILVVGNGRFKVVEFESENYLLDKEKQLVHGDVAMSNYGEIFIINESNRAQVGDSKILCSSDGIFGTPKMNDTFKIIYALEMNEYPQKIKIKRSKPLKNYEIWWKGLKIEDKFQLIHELLGEHYLNIYKRRILNYGSASGIITKEHKAYLFNLKAPLSIDEEVIVNTKDATVYGSISKIKEVIDFSHPFKIYKIGEDWYSEKVITRKNITV